MTARLASALTRMLAGAALLLPADRRPWAEALQAEADQAPAGWPHLAWLAGGFWLIAKESGMARKIGYWIGVAGIAAAVALVVWLSWRAAGPADPESLTDRVRVLVERVRLPRCRGSAVDAASSARLLILAWLGSSGSAAAQPSAA